MDTVKIHHPILEGKPLKKLPAPEELLSRNEEPAHGTSAPPPEENKRNAVRNPLLIIFLLKWHYEKYGKNNIDKGSERCLGLELGYLNYST